MWWLLDETRRRRRGVIYTYTYLRSSGEESSAAYVKLFGYNKNKTLGQKK